MNPAGAEHFYKKVLIMIQGVPCGNHAVSSIQEPCENFTIDRNSLGDTSGNP